MISKQKNLRKIRWIVITLFFLFLIGISSFIYILFKHEQKNRIQDTLNKGNYLASLISLHPISDFQGDRRDFYLRTLAEYVSSEGLVYCMIVDQRGRSLLSLAPHDLASRIPNDINLRSLHTMGFTRQLFKVSGMNDTIHEFSKPIFERGQRAGTVRLGFKIPPIPLFSLERISLLAMITFLIFSTGIFVYYGVVSALQPLRILSKDLENTGLYSSLDHSHSEKNNGLLHMIQDLELSFVHIMETLKRNETSSMEMSARLGVANFEKSQISRIINSLDTGIIITDIHDHISYINAYMLKLLDRRLEDMVDHPLGEVLDHEEIKAYISQRESVGQSPNLSHIETTFPELAPGKTFQISSTYIKDEEGVVTANMFSIKDITSQKTIEHTSQDFIAQAAHEFLTPLTTIGSYSEMLIEGEIEDKEMQKEFFNTIGEETARLSRLIQNLLSIAKIEMGGLTLQRGLVKTDWLVQASLSAVEGSALKKQITLKKNLPEYFPSLTGDKDLLKTAIINLLGNAVKYCPEKGTITFSLIDQSDMVIFDIIDTGYGISREDLPYIFDKFYRSKEPHIAEQSGSGLGLAMTANIIHLHGGEIEVQSELNDGTQFTIRIPKEEHYIGAQ